MAGVTAVRETRGPNELAHQRACAESPISPAAPAWERAYETEKARGVLAVLDWLEGRTPLSPVTGDPVDPDQRAVETERLRAEDLERRALLGGVDGTYPGQVGLTLSWYLKRAFVEAPY